MREVDLLHHLELVVAADRNRRRRPLADAIHGENQRLLERRRIECRRAVALMMLGKQQPLLPVVAGLDRLELVGQEHLLEQLFLEPHRQRHAERLEAARREREVGLEQPLELQERLVVEYDVVDGVELDAGLGEAIVHGVLRIARVMLLAGEALLLRRRDDLAVLDQRGCAVVVERRDAEERMDAQRF